MSSFKEHHGNINKNKNLKGRFCVRPFQLLEIQKEFQGFACCPSWLPKNVGDCEKTSISEVWNSKVIQDIRQTILDGTFSYCDHVECPEIQGDLLPKIEDLDPFDFEIYRKKQVVLGQLPREIALCYDESCNLSCPSCRSEKILDLKGKSYERKLRFTNSLIQIINKNVSEESPLVLRVTGSGDPLASPIYFRLLQGLEGDQLPNLEIILQTNAVMLTESNWDRLKNIHKNISAISVSIDASSEETYRKVRRLGSWQRLQKNLKFIAEKRKELNFSDFCLNFVVQNDNFFEMADFVRLGLDLKEVTEVFFSFVNDWNTWPREVYERQCIWKKNHENFHLFLSELEDPVFDHPIVKLGTLTEYRKLAILQKNRYKNELL